MRYRFFGVIFVVASAALGLLPLLRNETFGKDVHAAMLLSFFMEYT
jgi:hypothetical protein